MSLAKEVLESIKKLKSVSSIKENDDMPTEPQTTEPEKEPETTTAVKSDLETKLTTALTDMGLVSIEVVEEEDTDTYVDMVFEDQSKVSLQLYVEEGVAKLALLTPDNLENPPIIDLPSEFVAEDGTLSLADVSNLPVDMIRDLVSKVVTVTNQTEVCRRSRGTSESFTQKRMKRRVTTRLKNEVMKKRK